MREKRKRGDTEEREEREKKEREINRSKMGLHGQLTVITCKAIICHILSDVIGDPAHGERSKTS